MLTSRSFLLVLAASLTLGGCPKKAPKAPTVSEEDAANPVANFDAGVQALVPDRKGVVNYAAAYDYFAKAESLGGGAHASFNAGWTAEQLGQTAIALKHYRKANEADPTYAPALYSAVRLMAGAGQSAEIPALFEAYLAKKPEDADVRVEYIDALVQAGRQEEAITQARAILAVTPNSDGVYRALSSMYLKNGDITLARLMADKALEINDANPDIYNNLGVVLLRDGHEAEAIEQFELARHLDSQHFEANMNLGSVALSSADYALALECFEAAHARNPTDKNARLGLAVAKRGMGDLQAASDIYDQLIKEDPSFDPAWFNAATLQERYFKDYTRALGYLSRYKDARAGSLSPDDPVFKRMTEIEEAKAAEEARKRKEEEQKRQEEERKKRALELLNGMKTKVTAMRAALTANASCLPEDSAEEIGMILDQADEVIQAQDTGMASDVNSLLNDYYAPQLDELLATHCASAAAPAEEAPPAEAAPEAP